MAQQPSRTDTVGAFPNWNLLLHDSMDSAERDRWLIRKLKAAIIQNGRYQVRKLYGIWCIINPLGRIVMYSDDAAKMCRWAHRYTRLRERIEK